MIDPVRAWERDLQWGLCREHQRELDETGLWLQSPEQESPTRQRLFLLVHGEDAHYGRQLALAGYNAAVKVFQSKQAVVEPQCSVYAQSELGSDGLHVHLVMGGPGLNKYNAKAVRRQLQLYFYTELCAKMEGICKEGVPEDRQDVYALLGRLQAARDRTVSDDYYSLVDVMTYRTRAGGVHVARIRAQEFLVNYLLCKNARFHTEAPTTRCTLDVDWFTDTGKTYQSTILNGESIPLGMRRQLWLNLQATNVALHTEPSFGGELFGQLPKVQQAGWRETEKAGGNQRMTKRESLMVDCLERCRQGDILTYEQLVAKHSDMVVMLEASPGGGRLIEQILQMVHIQITKEYTPLSYLQHLGGGRRLAPGNKAWILISLQGYNPWQLGHWVCTWLNRTGGKQNTLSFFGPASTGKTNLAKAIVGAVKLYGCVNHQNKNFIFNDCAHKLVVWWEECLMHQDWVEQAKCIMGGTEFRIDKKHKESQLLPQTPVIVSTNNDIYSVTGGNIVSQVHAKPLKERVVQVNFLKRLSSTFGEIATEEIYGWLNECAARFEPTLEGFLKQWGLERLPNTFPICVLCSGCSQDWELHENCGPCQTCGGVPELETQDRGAPEPGKTSRGSGAVCLLT
ncbi:NS1 [Rhinolophus pusillus bocaparvovirus 1]|uniref:NS1 n=1 Tax=Rhinolophus pusillus bocaparvovirus 1 TaxID=2053079 RepID=UPI000CA3D7FB|nr:NS1 [Rhinolophus pusillus bocaparvovirus 1]ATV81488.1 NS1 [Rhinolophus pusillus bocaparvovirus 1]